MKFLHMSYNGYNNEYQFIWLHFFYLLVSLIDSLPPFPKYQIPSRDYCYLNLGHIKQLHCYPYPVDDIFGEWKESQSISRSRSRKEYVQKTKDFRKLSDLGEFGIPDKDD